MAFDPTRDGAGDDLHVAAVAVDARCVRLDVRGDLDSLSARKLTVAFVEALGASSGGPVELNLAGVRFLDAAGVRCLVTCRQAADSAGVSLVLRDPSAAVLRVLDAAGARDRLVGDGAGVVASGRFDGELEEWRERSAQLRQQAQEMRARAREAVTMSKSIRRADG